jgi:hypothetical protein
MKPDSFKPAHWLEWFTEDNNPRCDKPFLLNGHSVATNDLLCVFTTETTDFLPHAGERSKLINKGCSSFISTAFTLPYTSVSHEEFLLGCGGTFTIDLVECPSCEGTGEVYHSCNCEFCDETDGECRDCTDGKADGKAVKLPEQRIRKFAPQAHFDTRLIAYLLMHAPKHPHPSISYGIHQTEKAGTKLYISAPFWGACIQGCDPEMTSDAHEFSLKEADAR